MKFLIICLLFTIFFSSCNSSDEKNNEPKKSQEKHEKLKKPKTEKKVKTSPAKKSPKDTIEVSKTEKPLLESTAQKWKKFKEFRNIAKQHKDEGDFQKSIDALLMAGEYADSLFKSSREN